MCQQSIEHAWLGAGLYQFGITQAAVIMKLGGAENISSSYQKTERRLTRFDELLQFVRVEGAVVHGNKLAADGEAGVEGRAVPGYGGNLPFLSQCETAGESEVCGFARFFLSFDPFRRGVGIDELVTAAGDALQRRMLADALQPLVKERRPVI